MSLPFSNRAETRLDRSNIFAFSTLATPFWDTCNTTSLPKESRVGSETAMTAPVASTPTTDDASSPLSTAQPTTFANGRYEVKRSLGEGGKKRVYLAQDTLLDREVAFALIKTEGLDEVSRTRITREAQAMGEAFHAFSYLG